MLTTFSGRRASQNETELRRFISFLLAEEVRHYLEIGAREGDTFHEVMMALPLSSSGVAVDMPGGLWGKCTTGDQLRRAVLDLQSRKRGVRCLLGNSTSACTIEAVRQAGPYDAILIDGDHTYEGVKQDWENYRSMARIVAFHDIVGEGQKERGGRMVEVPQLWAELKASGLNCLEFVAEGSAMGIGAVIQ